MIARWWYFAASYLLLLLPVCPWSWFHVPKHSYLKSYKSINIVNKMVPRCHRKHINMMNKDAEDDINGENRDDDSLNNESNDEDYEIFENTPDFTTLGHKIVSTTDDRVEVLFIKLVMSRLKVVSHIYLLI